MSRLFYISSFLIVFLFLNIECSRSGRKSRRNVANTKAKVEKNDSRRNRDKQNNSKNPTKGVVEIPLRESSGVYYLPVMINGVEIEFIFDTGASMISLSGSAVQKLVSRNVISEQDITGNQIFIDANGDRNQATTVNLRKVELGSTLQRNVEAVVINSQTAECLLGQTWLKRFGKFSIDYDRRVLILEP